MAAAAPSSPIGHLKDILSQPTYTLYNTALDSIYMRENINKLKTRAVRFGFFGTSYHLPQITSGEKLEDNDIYRFIEIMKLDTLDTDKSGSGVSILFQIKNILLNDIINKPIESAKKIITGVVSGNPREKEILDFINKFFSVSAPVSAPVPTSGMNTGVAAGGAGAFPTPPTTIVHPLIEIVSKIDSDEKLEIFMYNCGYSLITTLIFYSDKIIKDSCVKKRGNANGNATWKKMMIVPDAIKRLKDGKPVVIMLDSGETISLPTVPIHTDVVYQTAIKTLMRYINTYIGRYCSDTYYNSKEKETPSSIVKYRYFYILLKEYSSNLKDPTEISLLVSQCGRSSGGRRATHKRHRRRRSNRRHTKLRRYK